MAEPRRRQVAQRKYTVDLRFKFFALAPQIYVTDADGRDVFYIQQKLFRLKERIAVFSDPTKSRQMAEINADRVLDFSANYRFSVPGGEPIGSIRRHGLRSLWRGHYELADAEGRKVFEITEENPWAKVADSLLGNIPILGAFSGFFFHPIYRVIRPETATPSFRLRKQRSFLEARFRIEKVEAAANEAEEISVILGTVMLALLERERG